MTKKAYEEIAAKHNAERILCDLLHFADDVGEVGARQERTNWSDTAAPAHH
jgi:hypothetical protein